MPTALIVEDEPEANRLLAMLVQLRGYRAESAYTGAEALRKVGQSPPDLVFLDLMLPDLNGYEVCKAIKAQKATTAIPVVMVTARVAAENRLESFRVGADDYIPKPYTPDEIFRALADADAWRRELARDAVEGEIRLEAHDEAEAHRELARLRNLLLARTTLDLDAVLRLGSSVRGLCREAIDWGRAHGADRVATLSYRLQPDRLAVTLRDDCGWLDHDRMALGGSSPPAFDTSEFDEIDPMPGDRQVRLLKRLADGAPPASA